MPFNDRQKEKEYRERNSSSLNPRGHHVSSRNREKGEAPYKESEQLPTHYAVPSGADSMVARAVDSIINRELFWGDVRERIEKNYKVPGWTERAEFKRKLRKELIMSLHSLIANGGKIVVVGGRMNPQWEKYAQDPRFEFWTGDRSEIERNFPKGGRDALPSNTHGIILSRFMGHTVVGRILDEARRRRLTIMGPKNDGEVTRLLEEIMTPPTPTPTPTPAPKPEQPRLLRPPVKGELLEYAKKYDDATKTIREMGAVIFQKMKEAGIQTTLSSVEQSIGNMRRAAGVFANPKLTKAAREAKKPEAPPIPPLAVPPLPPVQVAPPPPPSSPPPVLIGDDGTLALLKMIEDLKAGLDLLQDTVKRMHEQNSEYRQLEAKLAELGFIRK